MSLLAIRDLAVDYPGHRAVAGASLSIAPGEIVGLVGRSGSGKSTLALAALGLLPATATVAGSIALDGHELVGADAATLRRIRGGTAGMIFQEPMSALNPLLTIGAQVAETLRLHRGLATRAALAEAARVLAETGLTVAPTRYPHELSGGQRQRVAIAIAIAAAPKLLIADEPTTALDGVAQGQVIALLERLAREQGMALLLVSHDLGVVAATADRIAVMDEGRIVEEGPPATLLDAPTNAATEALIAAETIAHRPTRLAGAVLLEARGLERRYRGAETPALDDVALTIGAGETVGLIGASGSGKSTLVRALLALEPLDAGVVAIGGERFAGERRLRRRIQAVFQDPIASFDPRWTVRQIIAEPLALLDAPVDVDARVADLLGLVDLPVAFATRRPGALSGGQRQRVAIARALAVRPDLVLLDEALSALDPVTRGGILALIADLSDRLGTAWLLVSHDIGVVARVTSRLYVMKGGRIVEEGPTAQVLGEPRHAATRALVPAYNLSLPSRLTFFRHSPAQR